MPTPTIFEGINPRGTQNFIPCKDKAAVDWSSYAKTGAKNRIGIQISKLKAQNTTGTWTGNTYTKDGVTFECTVDSAGYVTNIRANGTASSGSAQIDYDLGYSAPNGSYKLNGAPAGGGTLQNNNWFLGLYKTSPSSANNLAYDLGEGTNVNINFSEPLPNLFIRVGVSNGKTITNGDFKPMLYDATDSDSTYAPYAMTNKELTDAISLKTGAIQLETGLTNGDFHIWEKNGIVSISGVVYNGSFTHESYTDIGTISGVSLPSSTVRFTIVTNAPSNLVGVITTAGKIRIYDYGNDVSTNVTFNFTYMI